MKKSLGAKTLIYPNPVLLIGTYDEFGKPNIMTASWGGICCSDPVAVAVSVRKSRYTFNNIMLKKAFTISIPSEKHVKAADYCGIYSGRDENKFNSTNLTPVHSDTVDAPYIDEFPIVLSCKLLQIVEIGAHTQFIGEIIDVLADENVLNEKNIPMIKDIAPILYDYATKTYYGVGDKLLDGFSVIKKSE